jgi:hypothetical protein
MAEGLNTTAIQRQVHRTAGRLGGARYGVRDGDALLEPSAPGIVGPDGALRPRQRPTLAPGRRV